MPEEELFKTEEPLPRREIADVLRSAADDIESGFVHLESQSQEHDVKVPANPSFEVELERLTDSDTGEQRYELEYELHWRE